jgi:predicted porin
MTVTGGLAGAEDANGEDTNQGINTGLLPAWLGFTGTTRQNDLDVSWTISMQPAVSDNISSGDQTRPLWRQAFLTFGDKSWGQVKLGKDLGIFAGNAILNDMTLLGVGAGGGSGGNTTLGGIGSGYIYPAWKGQFTYTTPNFNGFTAKLGITNPNQVIDEDQTLTVAGVGPSVYQDRYGVEGQLEYAFDAGKVWSSFASYKVTPDSTTLRDSDATAIDVGAAINFGNIGLVAYYYTGEGVGTTSFGSLGVDTAGNERDSDGGYVQATYVIPSGTKLGVAYGVSSLDEAAGENNASLLDKNSRWTVGAYHPLTKHLNLVAEYNNVQSEAQGGEERETDSLSLGAILFF